MIKHVVTFTWQEGVIDEQVADVVAGLTSLPSQVDALEEYIFGPDLGLTEGTGDFAIIATVADPQALRAYLEHPDHVVAAKGLRALASSRIAVQIEA